ncbi:MAG: translation initiation factor eIF-2B subunit alpha [Alyxoria varia]|nr:MAG: translation initiation factor eIF-2B subunit alpha [Alyxoria varia]
MADSTSLKSDVISAQFDIHQKYIQHLKGHDPLLPPYLACVSALCDAVAHHSLNTLSETLDLLTAQSSILKNSVSNPIPIAAGADRFQQVLISKLSHAQDNEVQSHIAGTRGPASIQNAPGSSRLKDESSQGDKNFAHTKSQILQIGSEFVVQGLAARDRIASFGSKFLRDGTTVIVPRCSKVVENLLLEAAGISQNTSSSHATTRRARKSFRVVFVVDEDATRDAPSNSSWKSLDKRLRKAGISTTSVQSTQLVSVFAALPRSLDLPSIFSCEEDADDIGPISAVDFPPSQTILLIGVPALFASGGVLASTKVQNAAWMAKSFGREVWVAAENNKMVKDIILTAQINGYHGAPSGALAHPRKESSFSPDEGPAEEMGMILSSLLTGIITEFGPQSTDAVAERGVKFWF